MVSAGNFGVVKSGYWKKYKLKVAVKILSDNADADDILKEADIMKKLRHPKVESD